MFNDRQRVFCGVQVLLGQAVVAGAVAGVLGIANRSDEAEEMVRRALGLYELKGNLASAERVRALLPDATLAE